MDEVHRDAIRHSTTALVKDMEVSEVVDHLFQNGIVNDYKRGQIMAKTTRHEKVRTLLDQLTRSSDHAFDVFLQALNDTNQEHLARAVEKNLELLLNDPVYDDITTLEEDCIAYFKLDAGKCTTGTPQDQGLVG